MIVFKIKKIYIFCLAGLLFLITLILVYDLLLKEQKFYQAVFEQNTDINFTKAKEKTTTLIFVGDIMLNRGVEYMVKEYGDGDYRFSFLKIADYLKDADILFGNLESIISDKGEKAGSIYSFRAEPEAIDGLKYAGFDVLSLANNHIFDYGRSAMEDCVFRLREAGIDYVGAGFSEKQAQTGVIKEIKGTKIAFLAYTNLGSENWRAGPDFSGIAWLDQRIEADVKKAKAASDLVVVSFHWGEEYQKEPNSEQKHFAYLAIDSGADLVVGHHPHVIQPIEKYKQGWIAYSLGNFIFDQGFSEETMRGRLLEVLIKNGKIKQVIPKDIKINNYFQPELLESSAQ